MSDKSFGDNTNRNVMKNPLLSSAVTGLSIEDLTHNAVLLPAAPSRTLIARQAPEWPETGTPLPTQQGPPNAPFGDANSNQDNPTAPDPKPPPKPPTRVDEEFNMEEYYARLQSTRYVSAPLTHTKEDQNSNLEPAEENLEEINLNEPERTVEPHSLTADLAQNFSQLPTVLPQVASAVFNSFSSMLYKSREHTPDERSRECEQSTVPLLGGEEKRELVDEGRRDVILREPPKEPLKEPPVGGTANYRIMTKKKAYAQIPGLSSGGQGAIVGPAQGNEMPTLFTPPMPQTLDKTMDTSREQPQRNEAFNIFNPNDYQASHVADDVKTPVPQITSHASDVAPPVIPPQAAIIPPPPMFSNISKNDGDGKKPLPSIGRRAAKPQAVPSYPNIFVPLQQTDAPTFGQSSTFDLSAQALPAAVLAPTFGQSSVFTPFGDPASSMPVLPPSNVAPIGPIVGQTSQAQGSMFVPTADMDTSGSSKQIGDTVVTQVNIHQPYLAVCPPKVLDGLSLVSPNAMEQAGQSIPVDTPLIQQPNKPPAFNTDISLPDSPMIGSGQTVCMQPTSANIGPASSMFEPTVRNVPPPAFFNPSQLSQDHRPQMLDITKITEPAAEPPKPVGEPPKISGGLSYRMTKKRPQYYSGPIEGVGSISNNVKPILPPVMPPLDPGTSFGSQDHPAMPTVAIPPAVEQDIMPFDIGRPAEVAPQVYNTQAPEYNTAFDLSRQTTDNYDRMHQEPKGFDIFGSLKSKLSSIDINKIQSKVTTFFDPAYNDSKKDVAGAQKNVTYQPVNTSPYDQYAPGQSNFEIFLPETTPTMNQGVDYQMPQSSYSYGQTNPHSTHPYTQHQTQYISAGNYFGGENTQSIAYDVASARYAQDTLRPEFTEGGISKDILKDHSVVSTGGRFETTAFLETQTFPTNIADTSNTTVATMEPIPAFASPFDLIPSTVTASNPTIITDNKVVDIDKFAPKAVTHLDKWGANNIEIASNQQPILPDDTSKAFNLGVEKDLSAKSFFNNPSSIAFPSQPQSNDFKASLFTPTPYDVSDRSHLTTSVAIVKDTDPETPDTDSGDISDIISDIASITLDPDSYTTEVVKDLKFKDKLKAEDIPIKETNLLESLSKDVIPIVAVSTVPLFGLSTIIAESFKDTPESGADIISVPHFEPADSLFQQNNVSFFENVTAKQDYEHEHDRGMYEACGEDEDGNETDMTSLLNNINAPVQLSNPVEALLTEDSPGTGRGDYDTAQMAEISQIAEDTIDTLNVQSAIDMLNDDSGWAAEETAYAASEHNYTYQLNANTLGLLGSNPLFFEDVPNNASDEIKAKCKHSQEDSRTKLPSIPPATQDDPKTDEPGCLDVHSIEEDAKEDFPYFEEFVVEPAETDDTKIESKERDRTSESSMPDTFTNRVARFKKMEVSSDPTDESNAYKNYQFSLPPTYNPNISIASYFDTGNYAAETHYKNSAAFSRYCVGSPNMPIRIPPGFEEEYHRRMSAMAAQNILPSSEIDGITNVPETSTQTKTTTTLTHTTLTSDTEREISRVIDQVLASEDELTPPVADEPILATKFGDMKALDDIAVAKTDVSSLLKLETTVTDNTRISTKDVKQPLAPANIFGDVKALDIVDAKTEASNIFNAETKLTKDIFTKDQIQSTAALKIEVSSLFQAETKLTEAIQTKKEIETPKDAPKTTITEQLPDPINFFASNETNTDSFNRLASYFSSPPPQPDRTKSFFELSQSQNHYRHESTPNQFSIPQDEYISNLNLINDLSSIKNFSVTKEQVVRTVNFFTVHYCTGVNIGERDCKYNRLVDTPTDDSVEHTEITANNPTVNPSTEPNIGEPDNKNTEPDINSNDFFEVFNKCVDCSNIVRGNGVSFAGYKVRKASDTSEGSCGRGSIDAAMDRAKKSVTVNFDNYTTGEEDSDGITVVNENRPVLEYIAVRHHWFYRVDVEEKSIWRGFSAADSTALENAFLSPDLTDDTVVPTDGGRYDVNVKGRIRVPVYWNDKPTNVRRCSWFYKGTTDARFVPYREDVAIILEDEYRHGMRSGEWHRRLVLPDNELVVMHGPTVMVHFIHGGSTDAFTGPSQASSRPRVVRRGCDESEIEDPAPSSIDHLLLLCHGVGSACDMRFRSVEEVVEDFRATSLQLLQSHYKNSYDSGAVNRVEVLPISWHATLHSGETGVDRRLQQLTLDSIPRLRNFTNDTVLDVLFYTSPVFCQTIIDTVCNEINRIYLLFKQRNPEFNGGVSLGGHSLGSVILYDLLCHQEPERPMKAGDVGKTYVSGSAGTGQPSVHYPKLRFAPAALYALGSPIAIFECIRGVESLGRDFALPTCTNFFNIFHPYDPIAYRIEPLVNSQLREVKPYLIPHHKGRKRMHLELKDTMARVGADLKQKLIESLKVTWNKWKAQPQPPTDAQLEKVVEEELEKESLCEEIKEELAQNDTATPEMLGRLNAGRRIDYVLQEAPLEMINEYLFAMSSHVGYWESEDTMLLMLREIYDSLGVQPDCTVPQQSMTVQRTRHAKDEKVYLGAANTDNPSTSHGGV